MMALPNKNYSTTADTTRTQRKLASKEHLIKRSGARNMKSTFWVSCRKMEKGK